MNLLGIALALVGASASAAATTSRAMRDGTRASSLAAGALAGLATVALYYWQPTLALAVGLSALAVERGSGETRAPERAASLGLLAISGWLSPAVGIAFIGLAVWTTRGAARTFLLAAIALVVAILPLDAGWPTRVVGGLVVVVAALALRRPLAQPTLGPGGLKIMAIAAATAPAIAIMALFALDITVLHVAPDDIGMAWFAALVGWAVGALLLVVVAGTAVILATTNAARGFFLGAVSMATIGASLLGLRSALVLVPAFAIATSVGAALVVPSILRSARRRVASVRTGGPPLP